MQVQQVMRTIGRRAAHAGVAAVLLSRAAHAQGGAPAGVAPAAGANARAAGAIVGEVYDGLLSQRPLRDAEVWIDGTARSATTDAAGRFRFDSLPAGRYRVTFFHPAFESVGLSAPVEEVVVGAGQAAAVRLSTPSAVLVHAAVCPGPSNVKTGLLVGGVRRADVPVANADVTATWAAYTVGARGIERQVQRASVRTGADGVYRLCGVPTDVGIQLVVTDSAGATDVRQTTLDGQLVAVLPLDVTASAAAPAPAPGRGVVAGVVRARGRRPVAGALVEATASGVPNGATVAAPVRAITDSAGRFVLRDLAPGAVLVEARTLGFRPVQARVAVAADRAAQLSLSLDTDVRVLAPTTVRERGLPPGLEEFEQRRRRGDGHFVSRDDIERRRPFQVLDMLMGVPGVQVLNQTGPGGGVFLRFNRGQGQFGVMGASCVPSIFLDGVLTVDVRTTQADQAPIDLGIRPEDVYGIEVYTNLSSAPARFQRMTSGCGLVLVWTRRGV